MSSKLSSSKKFMTNITEFPSFSPPPTRAKILDRRNIKIILLPFIPCLFTSSKHSINRMSHDTKSGGSIWRYKNWHIQALKTHHRKFNFKWIWLKTLRCHATPHFLTRWPTNWSFFHIAILFRKLGEELDDESPPYKITV